MKAPTAKNERKTKLLWRTGSQTKQSPENDLKRVNRRELIVTGVSKGL
jgi:hypothetical protein